MTDKAIEPLVLTSFSSNSRSDLLCLIGLLTHYLTKQLDDDDDDDKSEDEDSEEEDVTNTMLQNCLASIVEALSYNNPL